MNNDSIPFITVLMAVYNGERWLHDSIPSVLNQSFSNFEFIIVNDGSDDLSSQIINNFAKKDDRIRVFNKENSGLADSLNYGLSKARGEWVARLDVDDICHLDRLQKQRECVSLDDGLILVGSGLVLIDENGLKSDIHLYPNKHNSLEKRLKRGLPFFAHSSAFYKLSVVRKLGGYRSIFPQCEDLDLWLRIVEVGKITCIQEPLVSIRKHESQMSLEDSGQRQFVYSYMAMTSHFLRLCKQDDPMENGKIEVIESFYAFTLKNLEEEGFIEYKRFISELKLSIFEAETKFSKYITLLVKLILNPQFLYKYLKYLLVGSNLPKIIARSWSKKLLQT